MNRNLERAGGEGLQARNAPESQSEARFGSERICRGQRAAQPAVSLGYSPVALRASTGHFRGIWPGNAGAVECEAIARNPP
jgi:hypothetical protein